MATATENRRDSEVVPSVDLLGPIQEIIRQAREGKLTLTQLQAVVEHRNPFPPQEQIDLERAIGILGSDRVVTAEQACAAFNQPVPEGDIPIRYYSETLYAAAQQNSQGFTDWRLVYIMPLSIREQRDIIGDSDQPRFYDQDWYQNKSEDGWANDKPVEGYQLIDFKGRFGETKWADQDTEIAKLGSIYERADEFAVSQAVISNFKASGDKEERLLEDVYHWGRREGSDGYRVHVGDFDSDGLGVSCGNPSWDDVGRLVVCVGRKFDY